MRIAFRLGADLCIDRAVFETTRLDDARPVASQLCAALIGVAPEDATRTSATAIARLAGVPQGSAAARTVHYALSDALRPFLGRKARSGPGITCTCFGIETETIVETIRRHDLRTVEDVKRHLPASAGCGTCRPEIQDLLDEHAAG